MGLLNHGENIFIGDSAATSHMTSNKMGSIISRSRGSGLTTVERTGACKKNVIKLIWDLFLSLQHQEHLNRSQWQKEEYQR